VRVGAAVRVGASVDVEVGIAPIAGVAVAVGCGEPHAAARIPNARMPIPQMGGFNWNTGVTPPPASLSYWLSLSRERGPYNHTPVTAATGGSFGAAPRVASPSATGVLMEYQWGNKRVARCGSHNGKSIVFASDRDGDEENYVMVADGSNQTQLTFNLAVDTLPDWSANDDDHEDD